MMLRALLVVGMVGCLQALSSGGGASCTEAFIEYGISRNYAENIAHATHTALDRGLPFFNPRVGPNDVLPYLINGTSSHQKMLPHSEYGTPNETATTPMKVLDIVMLLPQKPSKIHGAIFSVIHRFHILDLLEKIRQEYRTVVAPAPPPRKICACLLSDGDKKIQDASDEFTKLYAIGNAFRLNGPALPKLNTRDAWQFWRKELLYYYSKPALRDAAIYLHCATMNL